MVRKSIGYQSTNRLNWRLGCFQSKSSARPDYRLINRIFGELSTRKILQILQICKIANKLNFCYTNIICLLCKKLQFCFPAYGSYEKKNIISSYIIQSFCTLQDWGLYYSLISFCSRKHSDLFDLFSIFIRFSFCGFVFTYYFPRNSDNLQLSSSDAVYPDHYSFCPLVALCWLFFLLSSFSLLTIFMSSLFPSLQVNTLFHTATTVW